MSRLLAATLGRLSPRFRTFDQWAQTYDQILTTRPISPKTLANRRNSVRYLISKLGDETVSSIKPHQVAQLVRSIHGEHPHTAHRVLIEAKDCFGEAVAYGWIHSNPAAAVKNMTAKVTRKRLSLDAWKQIHEYAEQHLPPWVSRMLVLALVTGQRRGDIHKMRFDDVRDGYLHVTQQKTGTRLRLPLALRLDAIDTSIGEAIEACRGYAKGDQYLIRKSTGEQLTLDSLSARFESAREGVLGMHIGDGTPPSLHEIRSLAERLYRKQGINTKTLLGHKRQAMTDVYNDDRGLDAAEWKTLEL